MLDAAKHWEANLLLAIQERRVAALDALAVGYTSLGDMGLMWVGLSFSMLCYKPTRKAGVLGLLSMALGVLCTNVILKHLVARPRPWLDVAGLAPLIYESDPNSFPSGHTCAAFAAAMIWVRALPEKWMRVTAVVLAVLMGLSRLYVGVHYPSDVVAGALVGIACAWVVWRLRGLLGF
jgi:undecaprenyl-diphosphatase